MSLGAPLLRVSCSICRGTLRRRPRPNPPPIHTAVVPELPGSLNGIDAGILPPRRATDASPRHPQKCRLYTVKANGLWPTPRNSTASMHRRHTRLSGFTSSCQRDHFLKTSGNQYRPQSPYPPKIGMHRVDADSGGPFEICPKKSSFGAFWPPVSNQTFNVLH